ncbi:methylated-DNA--[protein]-cysteine S-methyltransferase [Aminipila butyrica]|uniref:Methylated-DNA--protein-cysteine methyltransferase n=1 Tax=Aminipila butyrica TaxID=433296 RepID=A0A858BVV0_9FIRM|nr:methylated-DNA--[protein]-cysteine S-methyltransferase [Aminipila butyrica]QIB69309.1 methylated-DNA--[protein]-cysteine S-methyltransferase [Aminipila butyrica]
MVHTAYIQTTLGLIGISESEGFITELFFEKDLQKGTDTQLTPLLAKAEKQLAEYLSGSRRDFELPLDVAGTAFQKTVWEALRKIPYGQTRSYKQIAEWIGKPSAARAVGMANNKNSILILIPCHRVVGADGKLVGYAAGLDMKEKLLELERIQANGGKEVIL